MVSASHLQKKKVSHKEGHKKRAKLFQVNRNHIIQFANGVALSAKGVKSGSSYLHILTLGSWLTLVAHKMSGPCLDLPEGQV